MQAPRNINATDLELSIVSDLYSPGRNEDGAPYIGEVFFVQLDREDGRRWAHYFRFNGTAQDVCEFTGDRRFYSIRDEAECAALRLLSRIRAAGRINPDHWQELRPAYGSDAYIADGSEWDMIEAEKEGRDYPR